MSRGQPRRHGTAVDDKVVGVREAVGRDPDRGGVAVDPDGVLAGVIHKGAAVLRRPHAVDDVCPIPEEVAVLELDGVLAPLEREGPPALAHAFSVAPAALALPARRV